MFALLFDPKANIHYSRELGGMGGEVEEMGLAMFSFAALDPSASVSSPGVLSSVSNGWGMDSNLDWEVVWCQ